MYLKNLAVVLLITVFTGCAKELPEAVSEDAVTSLLVCILGNKCLLPRTDETIRGEQVYAVDAQTETVNIKYFFTDKGRFGISVKLNSHRQTLIEDLDLDGTVDRVTDTVEGVPNIVIVYGHETSDRYRTAQDLYIRAMDIAVKFLIPPELQETVKRQGKIRKKKPQI